MIKERSLVKYIIFTIITCGIYGFYWLYMFIRDVNMVCAGDGKSTTGLLKFFFFSLITFGIYSIVWYYALGDRLQDNGPKYNITIKESGGTVILWMLAGSLIAVGPFVAMYIIIKNINALGAEFNKKIMSAA